MMTASAFDASALCDAYDNDLEMIQGIGRVCAAADTLLAELGAWAERSAVVSTSRS